jgi:hypothetical protein
MLWTEGQKGSVDFYAGTLGFSCVEVNEDWGWANLSIDDVAIMFSKPNEHIPYRFVLFQYR